MFLVTRIKVSKKKKKKKCTANVSIKARPCWFQFVATQNHGEPIKNEISPGFQKDRSQSDQAYFPWLMYTSIHGRVLHRLEMCYLACFQCVFALHVFPVCVCLACVSSVCLPCMCFQCVFALHVFPVCVCLACVSSVRLPCMCFQCAFALHVFSSVRLSGMCFQCT